MRMTDRKPEELRLNAGLHMDSGKAAVRTVKDSGDKRSGDRTEGFVRKKQSKSTLETALDTAYKTQEYREAEEHNRKRSSCQRTDG